MTNMTDHVWMRVFDYIIVTHEGVVRTQVRNILA